MRKNVLFLLLVTFIVPSAAVAEGRLSLDSLVYQGAFRIPLDSFGESRIAYANGVFTVASDGGSFFVVGHQQDQAIAEFEIPEPVIASTVESLPFTRDPIQDFVSVFPRLVSPNEEELDYITGLFPFNDSLLVNVAHYYDAAADNRNTTVIFDDQSALSTSNVSPFLNVDGAYRAAGWVSPIPIAWQDSLGGDLIFGNASNLPINSRGSIGPSAFVVESGNIKLSGGNVSSKSVLEFSLENPLHDDLYNTSGGNKLWTELSQAFYGFIIPGSSTYAVFGHSGGHESGIGYKITQDNGNLCGGPCPYSAGDIYNYYWLWDANDFKKVLSGDLAPHQLMPYEYGRLDLEFDSTPGRSGTNLMLGASYDYEKGLMYFLIGKADTLQSEYESAPIMVVYSIGKARPRSPVNIQIE